MQQFFRNRHVLRGTLAAGLLVGAFGINATLNGNQPVPLPDGVVVFGKEAVTIDRDVNVLSGDVASNDELEIERDSFVLGSIVADEVELEQGVRIAGNVEADEIEQERATIEGEAISPRTTADFALPEIPAFTPGPTDLIVKKSEIATIQPGSYRHLAVERDARVTIGGGTYNLRRFTVGRDTVLTFTEPIILNIAETLIIERHVIFNLDSALDINDIRFNYTGTNTAKIERDSFVAGKLLAPNAAIFIGRDTVYRGQVAAKRVGVGRGTVLSREAAFAKPSDPAEIVTTSEGAQFPRNIILLNLADGTTPVDADAIAGSVSGRVVGTVSSIGLYQIEVLAQSAEELNALIQELRSRNDTRIVSAVPDYLVGMW